MSSTRWLRSLGRIALNLLAVAALLPIAPDAAAQRGFLIVVSGIGGEPRYSDRFDAWSSTLLDAAGSRLGLPEERILYLSEAAPGASARANGRSSKREIEAAIARVAESSSPGDTVVLVLIGHGTADQDRALFNLPGPDLSAAELDAMLDALAGRRVAIVDTSPSSGPFIKALSGPDRVVITATANATERYHTVFAQHFVDAFTNEGADADKNERVSLLEAFEFARRGVRESYTEGDRLQTEHALLDDNGDGVGSTEPGASDGALARSTYLEPVDAFPDVEQSEAVAPLIAKRATIEREIEALIREKQRLDTATYESRLEALLVEMALTHRAIRTAIRAP